MRLTRPNAQAAAYRKCWYIGTLERVLFEVFLNTGSAAAASRR
jgi:hypothetical protein